MTIDTKITYLGGYEGYATIYSEAPSEIERDDQIIVIPADGSENITLQKQTSVTTTGLATSGTDWTCYNAEAWSVLLFFSGDSYVYTNAPNSAIMSYVIKYAS